MMCRRSPPATKTMYNQKTLSGEERPDEGDSKSVGTGEGSASDMIITDADVNLCLGSGELLPCPFCGAWAMSAGELTPNGRATCWKVTCTGSKGLVPDCCASVWATHPDQSTARRVAVERWNRRKPNAEVSHDQNGER